MTSPRSPVVSFAVSVVRAWTRVYTWRMRTAQRERRRAEIESDLWESQQDHASAMLMMRRLLKGVPHDLYWRVEQFDAFHTRRGRAVALSATAGIIAAIVSVVFWLVPLLLPPTLPPPRREARPFVAALPPPPPPPPPPCRPPDLSGNCSR
jgi:hypothetical protein